jgi:phosphomannomutase
VQGGPTHGAKTGLPGLVGSMPRTVRISHVGLRGIVGRGLTAEQVIDFAAAFGTFLGPGEVVIGRDPRESGVMLRAGVVSGLLACGHDVIDLGVVSTPVIQHAIGRRGAAGGVSIGASHNSAEWNALKFLGPGGTYLSTAEAGELLDLYHLRRFSFATWEKMGRLSTKNYGNHQYLEDLAAAFDFDALKRFKVVIDCANGTSSKILRSMVERYGFQFILINERTGAFAHEPNTSAATVALQLAPLVKPTGADAGFLFDVDSDRVAMATEEGVPVSEEMMLPLLADHLLPRSPAKLVITNLSTTRLVEEIAARHGGTVVRVPVGRQAATDALASYAPEQIAIAGEGTGAVMMPRFRFVYDGIASMLAVLTMMLERNAKLSEILASYPRYCILKGQVPLLPRQIPALFAELERRYHDGAVNSTDGLRVDWPERWFHVRVSQTEPIVRVICEQRGDPPHALFEELMDHVREFS